MNFQHAFFYTLLKNCIAYRFVAKMFVMLVLRRNCDEQKNQRRHHRHKNKLRLLYAADTQLYEVAYCHCKSTSPIILGSCCTKKAAIATLRVKCRHVSFKLAFKFVMQMGLVRENNEPCVHSQFVSLVSMQSIDTQNVHTC